MNSIDLLEKRKIKKVAILGAGASADAGAPTISNFWDKIDELITQGKFNESEFSKINNIKQKREQLLPNSNIEEFYSYADFQIDFDVLVPTDNFTRNITYRTVNKKYENCTPITPDMQIIGKDKTMFEQLRKDISWLISKTLHETLKSTNGEITECYKKLIENFDVTLSFNWDVLYEYSYKILKGESIPFNQLGFSKTMLCKPALLKLHGSLSWGKCKKCRLYISDNKIEHLIHEGMLCPACNENNLTATSILPALNKFQIIAKDKDDETALPPFRNIWHCAMHALTDATEIYCFGYSLSDTDAHTQIFLKSALQKNRNSQVKVYVINKCCSEDLKQRYNKTLGSKGTIKFIEKTFKEFLGTQGTITT